MTRDEAKALWPIIKSFGEGKTIQILDGADWIDLEESQFADPSSYYRIKPEPRRFWIVKRTDGSGTAQLFSMRSIAEECLFNNPANELIEVEEKL